MSGLDYELCLDWLSVLMGVAVTLSLIRYSYACEEWVLMLHIGIRNSLLLVGGRVCSSLFGSKEPDMMNLRV